MKLLFASTNAGKIKEAQAILQPSGIEIISLDQLGKEYEDVEETGATFAANAKLKAAYFAQLSDLTALADDSGLEVETLGNGPGVNSNRWFSGSDEERNQALLQKLEGQINRQARFVTVACLYDPATQAENYFRGEVEGEIVLEPAGAAGFGYDPIFIPSGYRQTFAELGLDVKNQLSHRAKAYQLVREFLEKK